MIHSILTGLSLLTLTEDREKKESCDVVRGTIFEGGVRNCISGFEGSQAVPVCPSGRGTAYDRN
jgi:hypothetical protein